MLWRRSLCVGLSPFQKGAAVRSFTATIVIKFDEKEDEKSRKNLRSFPELIYHGGMDDNLIEIHKQLRSHNNCLIELRERMEDKIMNETKSDDNVQIVNNFRNLEALIQDEGVKTRSTIQDEEKKNRLIDAIWKLGHCKTTYRYDEYDGEYGVPTDVLRSILRTFLAGEEFHVKANNVGRIGLEETHSLQLRESLSVAIADLTGTKPQYKVNANNDFMIYHG